MLRIESIEVEASSSAIIAKAVITKRKLSSPTWEYFGMVETSDIDQINRLHEWFRGDYDIAEEVFFGCSIKTQLPMIL